MEKIELAKAIFNKSHLTGKFLLRSGSYSSEYFDKYLFESDPTILKAIASEMAKMIPEGVEVLAGLEMGGIPLTAALSMETGIPAAFVRKKAKSYGTCRIAEGSPLNGKKVLIIEDVVTSGGQIMISSQEMKSEGAIITDVLCVIDREAGGKDALRNSGLTLHPLFTMTDLKNAVK